MFFFSPGWPTSIQVIHRRVLQGIIPLMKAVLHQKRYSFAIAISVPALMLVLGCGGDDSGLARRYKVTGKVTYKGEAVPKGVIAFEPTKPAPPDGRVASGHIENGYYTLTTAVDGDGALQGEYKVTISASDIDIASVAAKTGGQLHQGEAEHKNAIKAAKNFVPAKYVRAETTPLTAKVDGAKTIDFDLKDE
jgi:hypothetical protein